MRILTIGLLAIFMLTSCGTKSQEQQAEEKKPLVNKEIDDRGNKMLQGEINEDNFATADYEWYNTYYDSYDLQKDTIDSFKDDLQDYDIKIFMGTWCPDSKRETPYFFKIMDYAGYPDDRIHMYAVDRNKKSLNGEEEGYNITHVPTFIFLKDGKEVGRIVESPINSLEEDIRDIINGTPQTPNYSY
ncbi:thiol reductase thioredoxin [Flavobacteriaceae bacterium Ap0902]|nr:thiol reductase thioredoxin [Flavobacteriaceae bacterium Ap0902]